MTAATHPADDQSQLEDGETVGAVSPMGAPANDGTLAEWPAHDWVAEATSGGAEYELYLDETTGLYEIRRVGGDAPARTEAAPEESAHSEPANASPDEPLEVITPVNDALDEPLATWASLAGPTGPSAFHTPLLWALSLTGAADFSPVPALGDSRGGSAWPLEAAA